ncbi:hypothetical protein [Vampirovibrio sp.]|uniref:hypothetical protein n=1 Tax=Vampirovibrio sp. TaxID=2717857 RepID=UPI0035946184
MRSRFKRHVQALLTSAGFVGMALVLTFFFYDGPLHPPEVISSALATDNTPRMIKANPLAIIFAPAKPPVLLSGGEPLLWRQRLLDNASIHLETLDKPLTLQQTTLASGAEAFDYAAYLYGQLADEVKSSELTAQFKTLKDKTQALGNTIRQASALRFDGAPTEDMAHLRVRATLMSYLQNLNNGAFITARYNQQGGLLEENRTPASSGQALTSYLSSVQQLLNHPAASQYPDTMRLVRAETALLSQLSQNMTLHWESTLYCPNRCEDVATSTRIYAQQALPADTLVSARL